MGIVVSVAQLMHWREAQFELESLSPKTPEAFETPPPARGSEMVQFLIKRYEPQFKLNSKQVKTIKHYSC